MKKQGVEPAGVLGLGLACLAQVLTTGALTEAQAWVVEQGIMQMLTWGQRAALETALRRGRQKTYQALKMTTGLLNALLALETEEQFAEWKALVEPVVAEMDRQIGRVE